MKLSQVLVVLTLTVMMVGCSSPGDGKEGKGSTGSAKLGPTRTETVAGISFQVPEAWKSTAPTSEMRAAQFSLPPAKEGEDAPELVLFFFGAGQGGGTQANIERWIGQMKQPDGKPSEKAEKQETKTVGDFKVTTVRVNGIYDSGMSMMPGKGAGGEKPGYRMWGAVVEANGGPWFFKATGPQKAMEQADRGLDNLISSIKPSAAPPDSGRTTD